ncbi:MAG: hypothetical protein WCH11_07100 [Bdellovibrio sp.]
MWVRIFLMTLGSSMAAMISNLLSHLGQISISMLSTRLSSRAHAIRFVSLGLLAVLLEIPSSGCSGLAGVFGTMILRYL